MRTLLIFCFGMAGVCAGLFGEETQTALQALRLLPKAESQRLARIAAREGGPAPERWHFLVEDRKAENGFREYVVAQGNIVASREVSQFAGRVGPEEIIGDEFKVDSDSLALLAAEYARASGKAFTVVNYELSRDGVNAAPIWRLNCVDAAGKSAGELLVSATDGNVISHEGFLKEPAQKTLAKLRSEPKPQIAEAPEASKPKAAKAARDSSRRSRVEPEAPKQAATKKHTPGSRNAETKTPATQKPAAPPAAPATAPATANVAVSPPPKPSLFKRMFTRASPPPDGQMPTPPRTSR